MATVPVEITWTTGQVVTAAQLNANVRDAINFLLSPPLCVAKQTAAQSMPNSAWAAMLLDAEDIDRDNGHSTVTNTSRYTAQTPGWYHADHNANWSNANTTGVRGVSHTLNTALTRTTQVNAASGFCSLGTSAKFFMNTGDYAEMSAYQNSGVALNTASVSYLQILWISS